MRLSPSEQGCPNSDDISAFVDGVTPEELAIHMESCAGCRGQIKVLRRIDAAIRRRLTPPAGLAERIRARVREEARREPSTLAGWWVSPVLRLAAVLVVSAAALAVLVHVLNRGVGSAAPTLAQDSGPVAPQELLPARDTGTGVPAVDYAGRNPAGSGPDRRRAERPSVLPAEVQHVWTVADAVGGRNYLTGLLPRGSYEVRTQEDGNTLFTMVLPDRDLQALVDRLYDHQWELASSVLPQPGKRASVDLRGQAVRYRLVLVNAGTPTQP